jgi:hypothetical protein
MDSIRVRFCAQGPKYMSSMVEESQFLHEEWIQEAKETFGTLLDFIF